MNARYRAPSFARLAGFGCLVASARRAARGKRMSNDTARFLLDLEPECLALRRELLDGSYRPSPYRTFEIVDPKPRTISAAAFRDRVVHHALCAEVEPALEHDAIATSFACRVGGGQRRALECAQRLVRAHAYVLKLDVEHFFETLGHAVLLRLLRRRLGHDERLMELASRFVEAGAPGSAPGRGVPIGNLTSQHFGNFYLGPLDRHIQSGLGLRLVRYMDDVLVFGHSASELWDAHRSIEQFVESRLDLRLKARVTRVMPVNEGVPFLGFRVFAGHLPFDNARRRRFVRRWRALARAAGSSREDAWQASATSVDGWAAHGTTAALRRSLAAGRVIAEEVGGRGGSNRVNRGGSWNNNAQNARAANRNNDDPGNRNNNLGFRLASTGDHERERSASVGVFTDTPSVHGPRPFARRPGLGSGFAPVFETKNEAPAADAGASRAAAGVFTAVTYAARRHQ